MLRYCVNLVLFATAVMAGWQIVQQLGSDAATRTADRAAERTTNEFDGGERRADVVSVAEAWQRYNEEVRKGIPCDDDVPPHPAVIAAVMAILGLRILTAPLRDAAVA